MTSSTEVWLNQLGTKGSFHLSPTMRIFRTTLEDLVFPAFYFHNSIKDIFSSTYLWINPEQPMFPPRKGTHTSSSNSLICQSGMLLIIAHRCVAVASFKLDFQPDLILILQMFLHVIGCSTRSFSCENIWSKPFKPAPGPRASPLSINHSTCSMCLLLLCAWG